MKEIKRYLETRIGKYSFFFEDLESGFTYGYNEHEEMTAAGCMKLPIAVSVTQAVEDGKIDFLTKIPIEKDDKIQFLSLWLQCLYKVITQLQISL